MSVCDLVVPLPLLPCRTVLKAAFEDTSALGVLMLFLNGGNPCVENAFHSFSSGTTGILLAVSWFAVASNPTKTMQKVAKVARRGKKSYKAEEDMHSCAIFSPCKCVFGATHGNICVNVSVSGATVAQPLLKKSPSTGKAMSNFGNCCHLEAVVTSLLPSAQSTFRDVFVTAIFMRRKISTLVALYTSSSYVTKLWTF